jgi:flavin-dependent dehydrogenase
MRRVTREAEVAVVGAGPAGAYASMLLARAGIGVLLVHRMRPVEKPCGGGVTRRALLDVPELPAIAGGRPIDEVVFQSPSGREVSLRGPELLRIYPRCILDAAVRDLAVRAGVSFVSGSVVRVERSGERFRLRGEGVDVAASFVVGADGVGSVVRRELAGPLREKDTFLACGYWVEGRTPPRATLRFEHGLRGYLWAFPRERGVSVGACALGRRVSPRALFRRAGAFADRLCPGAARRPYASRIPALGGRALARIRTGGNGFALVGDASGLVDPLTGEGIRFAFQTARLAAEAIASGDGGAGYAARVRREIVPVLASGARWRRAFYATPFLEGMVSLCARREAARRLLLDLLSGQQEYPGLLERLVREGARSLAAFGARAASV